MGKKAYFVGIKGVGMTSLALAMQDAGWEVSGSDTAESFITDDILASRGIYITTPVDAPVPEDIDKVIYSAAHAPPNTTVECVPLAVALADFVKDRKVIAVAGVGGKTTTSAMLAALFHAAGRDVGYYVGTSTIAGLQAPGHSGTDPYFIVEADEYAVSKTDKRAKFELLSPEIVITTNIVHDHPDIYPDEESTKAAFQKLVLLVKDGGAWIAQESDKITHQIWDTIDQAWYDFGNKIDFYSADDPLYNKLKLNVFGDQNRLDALAAVKAAVAAGIEEEIALESIGAYKGAGRRQESHGEAGGRLLYDDYGHHPGEVEVTVHSFKEHFPDRRIILVFESHTYTRTESLLPDFARAVSAADIPFIMPIFESAREKGTPHTVTPESFASAAVVFNPLARAVTWENAAETVVKASRQGDIILTMGAGFVYKLHEEFKRLLQ